MFNNNNIVLYDAPNLPIVKRKNLQHLYKCFNQIVCTAQLFGLLPVDGLKHNRANKIVFKWFSFNAIYCHLVILSTFIVVVISFYDVIACTGGLHKISMYSSVFFFFLHIVGKQNYFRNSRFSHKQFTDYCNISASGEKVEKNHVVVGEMRWNALLLQE